MKVIRSSKTSLKFVNQSKLTQLHKVMDEYSRVCNIFILMLWENSFQIKDLTKEITRIPNTWLSARMRQNCAREALSACDSAQKQAEESGKQAVRPVHYGKRMIVSSQIANVEMGKGSFDIVVTLTSIGKKIKIILPIKSHRHMKEFNDWKRSSSITLFRNTIQFSYEKEYPKKETNRQAIGVDIGINKLLVTSDGKQYGKKIKKLIGKIRRKQFKSKAYYQAKTQLKEYINVTTQKMFDEHQHIDLFVFEKIKGMKQNGKKRGNRNATFRKILHNWNYRYLLDYCRGQTEQRRSLYRSVNPYKTSQTCPVCSHVEKSNRVNEQFCCVCCGYKQDADVVGSINIVTRFTAGRYGASFKAVRMT